MIHLRVRVLGISISHFRGMGWSRGETAATHPSVAEATRRLTYRDEQVFVENSPVNVGYRLVRRLRRLGWEYVCQICGVSEWLGKPLRLHLDHINGISNDNRLENLRFLCPNCHSQTTTYCKKKVAKPKSAR
jgi:5-methylcytosine-specific restriction endonuclease McrA